MSSDDDDYGAYDSDDEDGQYYDYDSDDSDNKDESCSQGLTLILGQLQQMISSLGITGTVPESKTSKLILLDSVISHLFLPKITPNQKDESLVEIEQEILELAAETVTKSLEGVEFDELQPTNTMFTLWKNNMQSSDAKTFVSNYISAVSNLEVKNTVPIYLREQNCTILLTKLAGDGIQVETYRSSLPNQMVMSSVGSLSMAFPETTDFVLNKDLLVSETFAKAIYELDGNNQYIRLVSKAYPGKFVTWAYLEYQKQEYHCQLERSNDSEKMAKYTFGNDYWKDTLFRFETLSTAICTDESSFSTDRNDSDKSNQNSAAVAVSKLFSIYFTLFLVVRFLGS